MVHSPNSHKSQAILGQSQKPGTLAWSPMQVAGTKPMSHSLVLFQVHYQGTGLELEQPGGRQCLCPLCHSANPQAKLPSVKDGLGHVRSDSHMAETWQSLCSRSALTAPFGLWVGLQCLDQVRTKVEAEAWWKACWRCWRTSTLSKMGLQGGCWNLFTLMKTSPWHGWHGWQGWQN